MTEDVLAGLLTEIEAAETADRLRSLLSSGVRRLAPEADAGTAAQLAQSERLNRLHDAVIRRAVRLAEAELAAEGATAPCPYDFVLFGSGGRGEQSVLSDQDNGIVYAVPHPCQADAARRYFLRLGEAVRSALVRAGYPPCPGKVVCSEPAWCRSVAEWAAQLDIWCADPTWDHVRHLLIVADMRAVCGNGQLAAAVKERLRAAVRQSRELCAAMLRNTRHRQPAVGPLGNLLRVRYGPHTGGVEIKYGVYVPMVNAVRLLAVTNGVTATNTAERIACLHRRDALPDELAERALRDFAHLLHLRAATADDGGDPPQSSGVVEARLLTRPVRRRLKSIIATARQLHGAARTAVRRISGPFDD
jgi:CBS domain-containing protein